MYKITLSHLLVVYSTYITDHDFTTNHLKIMQLSICCYAYDNIICICLMPFQQEGSIVMLYLGCFLHLPAPPLLNINSL